MAALGTLLSAVNLVLMCFIVFGLQRRVDELEEAVFEDEEESGAVKHMPGCMQSRGCVPGCPNYDPKFDG